MRDITPQSRSVVKSADVESCAGMLRWRAALLAVISWILANTVSAGSLLAVISRVAANAASAESLTGYWRLNFQRYRWGRRAGGGDTALAVPVAFARRG
jgi:hypothetical protein